MSESLLVALDRIPEPLPAGGAGRCLTTGRSGVFTYANDKVTALADGPFTIEGKRETFAIDLSAPPLVDGKHPMRMDALEWALGVLARRVAGEALVAIGYRASPGMFQPNVLTILAPGVGAYDIACTSYTDVAGERLTVPEWPALDGLDEGAAIRLIVAAALNQGVGLEETP